MALVEMDSVEVNEKGVLVMHRQQGDEVYEITEIPASTMSLVIREKEGIMMGLGLDRFLTELNRTSDLLFLAYMGVVGTGELHARVSNRQMELSKLCAECLSTMTDLEEGSRKVLTRLTEAFKYLLKANEARALKELSRCAKNAETMATSCGKLAQGFGKLSDDTQEDAATAAVALGVQVTKVNELTNLRHKMTANKSKLESNSKELDRTTEDLKAEIVEETAKEDKAAERAYVTGIVSSIFGAIGAGLGAGLNAYMASAQPVKINLGKSGLEVPLGEKDASELGLQEIAEKADKAKKSLEDAMSAEKKVHEKVGDVRRKVFDAEAVRDDKRKRLDAAKVADKADEDKVRNAQAELDASSEKLVKLKAEQVEAEKELEGARSTSRNAEAALKGIAAGLGSAAESAGKVSQAEADRAKESGSYRRELLKQLRQQELRRESVGLLAELTSLLSSNTEETLVEESAQVALEIAGWALQNVFVALSNAKVFWDKMSKFCKKLADPNVIERINDEKDDGGSIEDRLEVYRSADFVKSAMNYVSQWAALTIVCGDYVQASNHARQSVLGHIKIAPSIKEATNLIGPLKERLLGEIKEDERQSAVKINDFQELEAKMKEEE